MSGIDPRVQALTLVQTPSPETAAAAWRVARVAALALALVVLAGLLRDFRGQGPALHVASAFGYLVLVAALLRKPGPSPLGAGLAALQILVLVLCAQRLLEAVFAAGLLPFGPVDGFGLGALLGHGAKLSPETALALAFLHLTALMAHRRPRWAVVTLLAAAGIVTLSLLQLVLRVTLWAGELSIASAAAMTIAGLALAHGLRSQSLLCPFFARGREGMALRALMATTVVVPWGLGLLYFAAATPAPAQQEALELVFGGMGWVMMALLLLTGQVMERARRALVSAATCDPLTGALNRLGLSCETARMRGTRGVILFDIDHFKRHNDRLGHVAGDLLLCETVAAARGCLRRDDLLARWGGEEFLAVIALGTEADLAAVAERIRTAIAALSPRGGGDGDPAVSASFGVALAGPGRTALEDAIDAADRALYAAKSSGRNRVCLAAPAKRAQRRAA